MRFALYLIPPEGDLYAKGSKLLGYDIRGQHEVAVPDFVEPAWVGKAWGYGFHITITDAIEIDETQLTTVMQKTMDLLACLRPDNDYTLAKEAVGFWGPQSDQVALRLRPNRSVAMLHDILVTALHPLGRGSEYSERLKSDPARYFPDSPERVRKTEQFYAPYIFDDFVPHFTLINPFTGDDEQRNALERDLNDYFADVETIQFETITLVTQTGDEPFRIAKEFRLQPERQ
jgi:hypothetical protein